MAFDISRFVALRPYLYHLTSAANLSRIRRTNALECASGLMKAGGRADLLTRRRVVHEAVIVEGHRVSLRDQAPLHMNNMTLAAGWTFAQFVEHLNDRVFFWPGQAKGISDYGHRHFERYRSERPVLIRVPTESLLASNQTNPPLFAQFNSGSPRASDGVKPMRGPDTFLTSDQAAFSASDVIEVTFHGEVGLPPDTELGADPEGPWMPLLGEG